MKYFVLILLMAGFIPIVSGICEDNQIDINLASLEELEKLDGIGSVKALAIIDTRLFDSVDDLVRVSGIKDGILQKIKTQGLACVENNDSEEEVVDELVVAEGSVEEVVEEEILEDIVRTSKKDEIVLNKKVEVISLNSEVAEEKGDLVYTSKNAQVVDYLVYGFALFLIFIIGFLIWERF